MKKVLRIKSSDLLKLLNKKDEKDYKLSLSEEECKTLLDLLNMFEGDNEKEDEILESLVTKLSDCLNK